MRARAIVMFAAALLPAASAAPVVEFDHVWIAVSPGAPERVAFQQAGFTVWPAVQRHVGQGTASVMVELDGNFIELVWRDTSVRVDPALEVVARKFALRADWRKSGWSPFGIAMRRLKGAPDSLPFATWSTSAPWMTPGETIQMITLRSDSTSPSVWVVGKSSAANNAQAPAEARAHASGAQRITHLELVAPARAIDNEPLRVLQTQNLAIVHAGEPWLLMITLDAGRKGMQRDLRPTLPITLHW